MIVAEQIAQSQLPIMNMDLVAAWKAKKALYAELREDNALMSTSTVLQDFYNTTANENIGALTTVEEAIEAALDTIIVNDTIAQVSLRMHALFVNNNIAPDLLPEYNQKVVNGIYLNSFANSRFILTQQELADALMVGNQCVYDGGPAVLTARLVVSTQYPFYLFNDNILCGGSTARVKPKDKKGVAAKGDFKIYPNPATDNLLVELPVEISGSLEIFNHLGQKVSSQKISERFIKANVKKLVNGFYYLVINGSNATYKKVFEVKR